MSVPAAEAPPESKTPEDSRVEMRELVLPNDTNTHGNALGGYVLHLMDIACAMAAMRHCRRPVVTATIDRVEFLHPAPAGSFLIIKASVNHAGRTSMEVGVKVLRESPLTGEIRHTSSAYLTFVALDDDGRPTPVPRLRPVTDDDKRRSAQAQSRVSERKRWRGQKAR